MTCKKKLRDQASRRRIARQRRAPRILYLRAATLRTGPDELANQGGAGGARASMQLLEVAGGPPVIHDNGTREGNDAKWHTFAPGTPTTDDYVSGHTFKPIIVARGGVLPADIGPDQYLRWELSGASRIRLEPGKTYAWMIGFDEPGEHRGLALANRNTAAWEQPIPLGPMKDGYAIRRSGSNDFHQVFFDPDDSGSVRIVGRWIFGRVGRAISDRSYRYRNIR